MGAKSKSTHELRSSDDESEQLHYYEKLEIL